MAENQSLLMHQDHDQKDRSTCHPYYHLEAKLEVVQTTVEFQVQSWATDSEFG